MDALIIVISMSLFVVVATTIYAAQRAIDDALHAFLILQNNKYYNPSKSNLIVIDRHQLKTRDDIDKYVSKLTLKDAEREEMRSGLYRVMGV